MQKAETLLACFGFFVFKYSTLQRKTTSETYTETKTTSEFYHLIKKNMKKDCVCTKITTCAWHSSTQITKRRLRIKALRSLAILESWAKQGHKVVWEEMTMNRKNVEKYINKY